MNSDITPDAGVIFFMHKLAIVLANAEIEDPPLLRQRLAVLNTATVFAADGGSRHADLLGLRVGVLIGDHDSLDESLREQFAAEGVRFELHSPQKDETDLELALLLAKNEGAQRIIVIGAMGGRMDMTLSNLLLLAHPDLIHLHIEIWDGAQTARIVRPPGGEVRGDAGDSLSLIALGNNAVGITTSHLAYPLANQTLHLGLARGVSNVLTASKAEIKLREGIILLVHTPAPETKK